MSKSIRRGVDGEEGIAEEMVDVERRRAWEFRANKYYCQALDCGGVADYPKECERLKKI